MHPAKRLRSFRLLCASHLVSVTGDGIYVAAIAWLVRQGTGSDSATLLLGASATLPFVVLGLVGGAVADRHDPRRIMIAADLARALVLLLPSRCWPAAASPPGKPACSRPSSRPGPPSSRRPSVPSALTWPATSTRCAPMPPC
ncbi:MAG TPA: MFS transporter [Deinococcales bacterium]|nr:MFS transporter [Deinococcales bacterium]